jgi:hypothetical protein
MTLPARRKLQFIISICIAFLSMAFVWNDARQNAYVPCVENCGETFRVFKYVQDYKLYGAKYGLIEDISDERSPDRTPLLYTHNMSLPGILFASLEAAGFHSLASKQFFILMVHGLGLFYAFLSVRYLSGSSWLGVVFSGLMAANYELVFGFALSPLRGWHWLALFGLLYHVGHVARQSRIVLNLVASALFATLAFGVGYDYFTICVVISGCCLLLFLPVGLKLSRLLWIAIALGAAFFVPVALRQAQIAFVMGLNYWWTDFVYTLMTKAAFLQRFYILPPDAQIEQFYRDHGVYRPPTADRSALELVSLLKGLGRYVLLPLFGAVTLLVFAATTTAASVAWAGRLVRNIVRPATAKTDSEWHGTTLLVLTLSAGAILGIAIFPDHNILIFIKHKVPLIAAPIMLAEAVALVWLGTLARDFFNRKNAIAASALAFLIVSLLLDRATIELDNIRTKTPYHFTWIDDVSKKPDATYAVSWDPTAVSVFVNTSVKQLGRRDELWLLDHLGQGSGNPPLQSALARPASLTTLPDYWLYFPTDAMSPYDSFDPACRMDYLSRWVLGFARRPPLAFVDGSIRVDPEVTHPGDFVLFGGELNDRMFHDKHSLRSSPSESSDSELAVNCHYQSFQGRVRTRPDQADGPYSLTVETAETEPVRSRVEIAYRLSKAAPVLHLGYIDRMQRSPMLTADAMSKKYPYLPVATSGPGWVMFDLRPFK